MSEQPFVIRDGYAAENKRPSCNQLMHVVALSDTERKTCFGQPLRQHGGIRARCQPCGGHAQHGGDGFDAARAFDASRFYCGNGGGRHACGIGKLFLCHPVAGAGANQAVFQ